MLFKKSAEDVKQKVDEVGTLFGQRLEQLHAFMKETSSLYDNRFNSLEIQLQQLSMRFGQEAVRMGEHLRAIEKAREDVEKSTRSFADVQRKIEAMLHEQLGSVVKESVDKLRLDVGQYSQVKKDIELISARLNELSTEIVKFKNIAEEIKHADFQLSKYAMELEKTDKEKVKLMKEVDDLQRLIARMRRER